MVYVSVWIGFRNFWDKLIKVINDKKLWSEYRRVLKKWSNIIVDVGRGLFYVGEMNLIKLRVVRIFGE